MHIRKGVYEARCSECAGRVTESRKDSVVVHEDNRARARESRRFQGTGRLWFLARHGERRGHHRDRRAGHVDTGVAWELERTVISLWRVPVRHAGDRTGPGAARVVVCTRAATPRGKTNRSKRAQGIGTRARREATRDGETVVSAEHRTDGRAWEGREGGEPRPKGPAVGKAKPGITHCRGER